MLFGLYLIQLDEHSIFINVDQLYMLVLLYCHCIASMLDKAQQ